MSKEIPQILKGFRDYLPQEAGARKKIISKISEVFERFGFGLLDTPALEYYDLLGGKYGDEGEKLMYRFKDQGDRDVALRYDLTVPLARVFAENKDFPKPFKRYQIAPVWRADKPQKGRFREFMQCDIDILGSESVLADVEVIAALNAAYEALEIQNFQVKFNDRKLIDQALAKLDVPSDQCVNFMRTVDKLDKVGETEIIKVLVEQGFDKNILSQYSETMDELSKEYEAEMQGLLAGLGVKAMRFDKYLMRGLDYYTGIIFEFVLLDQPEFGSVGSGGRYDGLIEKTTGVKTPAVGASLGLDRLFAALEDKGKIASQSVAGVILFNLDKNLTNDYLKMVTSLRNAGINTEIYYDTAKLDKQFKYAETKNISVAIIFGADESKSGKVNLKNLKTKEQKTVDLGDLVKEVKKMV